MALRRFIAALAGAALALAAAADAARALGGAAAATADARLESRAVMVLGTRGNACTGAVLAPRLVLTAAHCVSGPGRYAVAYREASGSPTLQEVREVARHPEFSAGSKVSIDLAVVRLAVPLPARFVAAALDGPDPDVDAPLTVAGFGLARNGDEASAGTLRQAAVTALPRRYPRYVRLGLADGGLSVCKGDSGAPAFAEGPSGLAVVAVVYAAERTAGGQCGAVAQAIRVAPQRAWIARVMAQWGS